MTKLQSPVDVAVEMLRDLEEFNRSGSKEAFRKQLCEEFVRRSGGASLDEALATAHWLAAAADAGTKSESGYYRSQFEEKMSEHTL